MAVVTFGGHIGSGKSTVAPLIARALGYESLYVGGVFREMAKEHGLGIQEFYASLARNPELEKSVDARQADRMCKGDVVVQGRVAFWLANQSGQRTINIFLTVDPAVGAERKIKADEYPGKTVEEVIRIHEARHADECAHYRGLYGIPDHLDPALYDIVCDTSRLTPDEVVALLLEEIKTGP